VIAIQIEAFEIRHVKHCGRHSTFQGERGDCGSIHEDIVPIRQCIL